MRVVAISDTHGLHDSIELPEGDLIVHAGDVSRRGKKKEIKRFLNWFSSLPYRYKVFIAGNHDFFFEEADEEEINSILPNNVHYLCNSGVELEGYKIWGSPIQPWFLDWAFNRQRGKEIAQYWDKIPSGLDLLLTHGPAYGVLDKTVRNEHVGCEDLLSAIKLNKPRFYLCGHIHEAYGRFQDGETLHINASVLDVHYKIKNQAQSFVL